MPDDIEMVDVKRGRFLTPQEADRQGYNPWLRTGPVEKGASVWGGEGLWPILRIILVVAAASWLTPFVYKYIASPIVDGFVHVIGLR